MTSREVDRRLLDRLVLAELPIGGDQVAEAQAAQRLDLGGERLRIVHRGGDQVIEVDVLDVERLPHLPAAVAQDLHHLGAGREPGRIRS